MKSWSEKINFTQPVCHVQFATAPPAVPVPCHAELQTQLQASYEGGRIDGEKAVREQLLQQRVETQELLNGVIASLRKAVPQVVHDTEQTLVTLALEIAQKLVADVPIKAKAVESAVREALAQVEGTTEFHVHLHPADLDLLHKTGSSLLKGDGGASDVHFQSSPEISRGGCLVRTRFGVIDARRETKIELLRKTLLA